MGANEEIYAGGAAGERSSTQLRAEVERTQADLHRNVRELNERANPSRVMARKKESIQGSLSSARERIMGVPGSVAQSGEGVADSVRHTTQGNPLAAGAVALGVGWIIGGLLPVSEAEKRKAGQVMEQAKEQMQPLAERAAEQAQPALDKINETVAPEASR
jgi:ElaB/YqjD/DUF883 family membrane-anchored ribosome-binding protein